jgi:hypothetical protein
MHHIKARVRFRYSLTTFEWVGLAGMCASIWVLAGPLFWFGEPGLVDLSSIAHALDSGNGPDRVRALANEGLKCLSALTIAPALDSTFGLESGCWRVCVLFLAYSACPPGL